MKGGDLVNNSFKEIEYYLYNYKNLDSLNSIAESRIKMLEDDITIRTVTYDEKTGPTNKFNSDVENEVIRRQEQLDKIRKLRYEINNRNNMKNIIKNYLDAIDPEDKKLIELRYFSKPKKSWVQVSSQLNTSTDWCTKNRKRIISNLSKLINI